MAPSGVLMIGLALVLRDMVQRRLGRAAALTAIVAGALLSGAVAPPSLVYASALAFLLSELADFAVYTPLQSRGLVLAVLASSVVAPGRRQHSLPVAGLRQPRVPGRPDPGQALDGGCCRCPSSTGSGSGRSGPRREIAGPSPGLHASRAPFLISSVCLGEMSDVQVCPGRVRRRPRCRHVVQAGGPRGRACSTAPWTPCTFRSGRPAAWWAASP